MHLEITTYIDCPNRCSYCPQETLIKAYKGPKVMSIDTFKKILRNVPPEVDIHFSGFSELFFHPDAVDFIFEAGKEHGVVVYTTTKGMSDLQYDQIKDFKFKEFNVHDRGARHIPWATSKIQITDSNKISRAGHLWDVNLRELSDKKTCLKSSEYKVNVVLPDGNVYLCCMDYGLEHHLGNILKTPFHELKRECPFELCTKCEWYGQA